MPLEEPPGNARFTMPITHVCWRTICAGFLTLALGCSAAQGAERACWVWNRAAPLTAGERTALTTAGVTRLYWQAGELELRGGALALRRPPVREIGADPEIVPVVRVSTAIRSPEQFTGADLGRALQGLGPEVQIDFDCPDRLLPVYAERLRTARAVAGLRRLTVTALAGWAEAPGREALWPVVDAVFPMLYDTEPDSGGLPLQPRTLLDPARLRAQLQSWSHCPIAWHAGLPVFSRVTLFDSAGRSGGHLRSWDWEDLVFNSALALDRPTAGGTTVLRAVKPTRVGRIAAAEGSYVVIREAPLAAVRAGIAEAGAAGARGVVFFRLPDPAAAPGCSLRAALRTFQPTPPPPPRLSLSRAGDGWTLRNASDADLPPRFAPDRAYALELEIAGGVHGWREALPGEFCRVVAHAGGDKPIFAPIPLAQRLTFWFAGLPAEASLKTGLVQLAPGIDPKSVRYRVCADAPWQSPD